MWHNTSCLPSRPPHTRSIYPLLAYAATRIPGMQGILSSICVVAFRVSLRNKQQLHLPVIFPPPLFSAYPEFPKKASSPPVLFYRSICRQWNDENSAGADNIRGRFVCSAQVGPSWVTQKGELSSPITKTSQSADKKKSPFTPQTNTSGTLH